MAKPYDKMTLKQLAAEYNSMAKELGKPTIKKFRDREVAVRRTAELASQIQTKPKAKADGRGRPSQFAGKKLFPKVKENPRLAGSHGWHAFKMILDKPGITYEDYIAGDGGSHHLRWDMKHGHVEVKG